MCPIEADDGMRAKARTGRPASANTAPSRAAE